MKDRNVIASTVGWWIVFATSIVAAALVDVILFPTVSLPIVYVPAVLIGCTRLSSRELTALVIACVLLNLFGLERGRVASEAWLVEYASFAIIGYLAVTSTIAREQARAERFRAELTVSTVERVRQPLTVILGYSQILETELSGPERAMRAARAIHQAAGGMRELLSEILRDGTLPRPPPL